jgi:hypothetical protein
MSGDEADVTTTTAESTLTGTAKAEEVEEKDIAETHTEDSNANNNGGTNGDAPPVKKKILLDDEEEEEMDIDNDEEKIASESTTPTASQQQYPNPSSTSLSYTPSSSPRLTSQIVTPSPFQHHNDASTSDRYRSALQRIIHSPLHDVEAWEALMTECMTLYRRELLPLLEGDRITNLTFLKNTSSSNGRQTNVELEKKLDWVESCHGHLLHYFPYTANYYVSALEVLLARNALPFESLNGMGEDNFSIVSYCMNRHANEKEDQKELSAFWKASPQVCIAEKKVEYIFENILGVKMDGTLVSSAATSATTGTSGNESSSLLDDATTNNPQTLLGGMCTSSIELWLLFIRKRSRDAKRHALQHHIEQQPDTMSDTSNNNTYQPFQQQQQSQQNQTKITPAGEDLIRDWIVGAYETALNNGAAFVYNNDIIWKQYLSYVKSWNVMTTSSTTNNTAAPEVTVNHMLHSKQKELLRSIYQRIVTLPMTGLDSLWTEYENYEKAQSEQLATALIAEFMPKYQHARSVYLERNRVFNIHELKIGKMATPPTDCEKEGGNNTGGTATATTTKDEEMQKVVQEMQLLAKWKKRCAYERTNPERLSNIELTIRVRQCFKDIICAFMRHIESWHEWSMWELYNTNSGASMASAAAASKTGGGKKRNVQFCIAVLSLAQTYIPDCTLLAYSNAMILEYQVGGKNGAEEAIEVMNEFCKRSGNSLGYVLLQRLVRKFGGMKEAREVFAKARRVLRIRAEDISAVKSKNKINSSNQNVDQSIDDVVVAASNTDAGTHDAALASNEQQKIVITRETFAANKKSNLESVVMNKNGCITWHLYASHAFMEHRINKLPQVAARVYELGLKKHRTFLATPQYVLQYSSLLFELGDEENLRALLTRAIAACEEEFKDQVDDSTGAGNTSSTTNAHALRKREKQKPLWDMMLMFESVVSARNGDHSSVKDIEARRRQALFGPENEDVSGAAFLTESEVGIGMHKISLSDTLIRADGYDTSSNIMNGLDRIVDTLEISGILGQESNSTNVTLGSMWKDDRAGGLSDSSFRRRKRLQTERSLMKELSLSGSDLLRNNPFGGRIAGSTSGKFLSAKERLAQSAMLSQNQSLTAAVLSSPGWLQGMLSLLPMTTRNIRGAKAPPHMIEMALAALKNNPLPTSRPDGPNGEMTVTTKKRKMNDGDSSDEEGGQIRSGYGHQFRNRQRAKLMSNV